VDLFIGKQECSVDDKRRFSLPPKFRDFFPGRPSDSRGQPAVLLPWYQGAVAILPLPYWNELETRIGLLDTAIPKYAGILNMVLARAERVETDPEGRLTLTPEQLVWMRLEPGKKSRVVVASQAKVLAVWNVDEYDEVVRTGNNPAERTADDLNYEKALEELMTVSAKRWETYQTSLSRAAAPPDPEA
jgi:DNA-binding transcriptional regulator/RsmH inhibitor MraZ